MFFPMTRLGGFAGRTKNKLRVGKLANFLTRVCVLYVSVCVLLISPQHGNAPFTVLIAIYYIKIPYTCFPRREIHLSVVAGYNNSRDHYCLWSTTKGKQLQKTKKQTKTENKPNQGTHQGIFGKRWWDKFWWKKWKKKWKKRGESRDGEQDNNRRQRIL